MLPIIWLGELLQSVIDKDLEFGNTFLPNNELRKTKYTSKKLEFLCRCRYLVVKSYLIFSQLLPPLS